MSITRILKPALCTAAALAIVGGAATSGSAAVVFSEDFEGYADTAALQAAWTTDAAGLALNDTGFDPAPTPLATVPQSTVTDLGRFNAKHFAYRSLPAIASDQDWTVTIDVISESYSRSNGFGLFDATGTNGYTVRWNTANPNNNSGRGVVSINEHGGAPIATTNDTTLYGTAISGTRQDGNSGNNYNSFHPATGYSVVTPAAGQNDTTYDSTFNGLVTFTLSYDASEGRLRLYSNGVDNAAPGTPLLDVVDATPANFSFERFYLMGQSVNFDNVAVDVVPEPGSLGLLFTGGLLIAARRRKD